MAVDEKMMKKAPAGKYFWAKNLLKKGGLKENGKKKKWRENL
jgi:hypothetical protein